MRKYGGQLPRKIKDAAFLEVIKLESEIADLQWQISQRMDQIQNIYRNSGKATTKLKAGDFLLCWPNKKDYDRDSDRVLYKFAYHVAREAGSDDLDLMVRKIRMRDGHKKGEVFRISPQDVDVVFPGTMLWYTISTILKTYKLI